LEKEREKPIGFVWFFSWESTGFASDSRLNKLSQSRFSLCDKSSRAVPSVYPAVTSRTRRRASPLSATICDAVSSESGTVIGVVENSRPARRNTPDLEMISRVAGSFAEGGF
jgi:hypothetical protein